MRQLFSKHGCFRPVKMLSLVLILGMAAAHPAHAQLVFDTPFVDFGKIEVGSSSPTIVVDLRNTGSNPLTVSCAGGAVSPTQFSGALACMGKTLNPGETCPFSFTFKPAATGVLSGSSSLTCNSVALGVNLAGEGVLPKLVLATPSIDFGPVLVDSTSPSIAVELINKGASAVVMDCAGGIPSPSQFNAAQACAGKTLEPGDSCHYNYDFTPDTAGDFSGNGIISCNGVTYSVELLGEGRLPALVMDKPAVDFGTVEVNETSPTVFVELRNQGPDPVMLSCSGGAITPSQFSGAQSCNGSSFSAGETCAWHFNFTPDALGEVNGSNNFSCNGVSLGVTLRGIGVRTLIFADSFE